MARRLIDQAKQHGTTRSIARSIGVSESKLKQYDRGKVSAQEKRSINAGLREFDLKATLKQAGRSVKSLLKSASAKAIERVTGVKATQIEKIATGKAAKEDRSVAKKLDQFTKTRIVTGYTRKNKKTGRPERVKGIKDAAKKAGKPLTKRSIDRVDTVKQKNNREYHRDEDQWLRKKAIEYKFDYEEARALIDTYEAHKATFFDLLDRLKSGEYTPELKAQLSDVRGKMRAIENMDLMQLLVELGIDLLKSPKKEDEEEEEEIDEEEAAEQEMIQEQEAEEVKRLMETRTKQAGAKPKRSGKAGTKRSSKSKSSKKRSAK